MPDCCRTMWARGVALCLLLLPLMAAAVDLEDRAERLAARMQEGIEAGQAAEQPLREAELLRQFYREYEQQSLWVTPLALHDKVHEMIAVLDAVQFEGLEPAVYHRPVIHALLRQIEDEAASAIAEQRAERKARQAEIEAELAALAAAARKRAEDEARKAEENGAEEQAADAVAIREDADEDDDDDDEDADDDEQETDDDDVDDDDEELADSDDDESENDQTPISQASLDQHQEKRAPAKGLPPIKAPPPRVKLLARLELLLTDAFLHLARHRGAGVVDPRALKIGWHIAPRSTDPLAALKRAAASGHFHAELQGLKPPAPEYLALVTALQRYLALADKQTEWKPIAGGRLLKEDMTDNRIPAIRQRLALTGDLRSVSVSPSDEYDGELVQAMMHYQQRHGLKADGIIGPKSLFMLNLPLQDKITALQVNLERWRWLPADLGSPHIRVNVAAFHMEVVENGQVVLDMPTIVGMPDRRTPNFSETMKYLVANPTWEVPPSIAKKDKIPIIRENLAYLTEHGFDVLEGWGDDEKIIDAASLDWNAFTEEHFPYHLRQNPGPTNALGRIKFMLPNRYNIYLHDTPAKHLFDAETRTFSSGCIRLQRPLELADYILNRDPRWKGKDIREILEGEPKQILRLTQHIPVHILYNTAWVDVKAVVHFREDVYNRDQIVIDAMRQKAVANQ